MVTFTRRHQSPMHPANWADARCMLPPHHPIIPLSPAPKYLRIHTTHTICLPVPRLRPERACATFLRSGQPFTRRLCAPRDGWEESLLERQRPLVTLSSIIVDYHGRSQRRRRRGRRGRRRRRRLIHPPVRLERLE